MRFAVELSMSMASRLPTSISAPRVVEPEATPRRAPTDHFTYQGSGRTNANALGPVAFRLSNPVCGLEFVGQPACNWGDHEVVVVLRPTAMLVVRAVDAISGAVVSDVPTGVRCAL